MKSNHINTNENPPATSASSPRDNPCFRSDTQTAALDVFAADGISYLLPYAQFLYAERVPNPRLEKEPDAPPEKMLIRFAPAEVVVLGSGLMAIERALQKYELKFVKAADRRHAATLNTFVASVAITLTTKNI
jgi:hypothetical protein